VRDPKDWDGTEQAVSRARGGRFRDELPGLLATARRVDGDRGEAWVAASAAVEILQWQDAFTEAADLAETLIRSDGPLGGELCDHGQTLVNALLHAEWRTGVPAQPRLAALADRVPEGRVLRRRIDDAVRRLETTPAAEDQNFWFNWGRDPQSPDGVIGSWVLEEDYASLPRDRKFTYWRVLHDISDFDRAERIRQETGELPDDFSVCLWLAGCHGLRGDLATGEELLLAAHARWWPFDTASALPTEPVANVHLRPLVTDRVREYYLTTPIGPEAKDRTQQS
jgi:hypothetical protein